MERMEESPAMRFPEAVARVRRYMRHLAPDRGWIDGSCDYVRFIVLARSRTGSNLLRSLLNAHSKVEAYGEIFRSRDSMDWDHIGYLGSSGSQRLLLDDPIRFVRSQVFRRYPAGTCAVGFKIFYYHAHDSGWKPIWDFLREQSDLHIIHVTRENILETHLSRKRAELTDRWVNTSGEKQEAPAVALDYNECLEDFERTRAQEREYEAFFATQPRLRVTYEDLARDHTTEMMRVFEFLGLPWEPVQPSTYRQSHRSLKESITNFGELKQKFAGSPWEPFFADDTIEAGSDRDKEA